MSRIERLINLSAALLSAERPLTAEELRERIGGYPEEKASFRRQFERDKDALRELGIPLETLTERRANDEVVAYKVDPDEYFVRDPGLEPDELSALHLAARLVEVEGVDHQSALWKLNAAARAERSRRRRKPSAMPSPEPNDGPQDVATLLPADDRLTELFGIIANGNSVLFQYKGEERHVQPRRLSFSRAHWYLAAYDIARQDDRSFRLDRMEGVLRVSTSHEIPTTTRAGSSAFARPWEMGPIETEVSVTLRVDSAQAPWAVRHVGQGAVSQRHVDGSVDLILKMRNIEALRTFVLGFLHHAEVISPTEIRTHMIDWLTQLAEAS